MNLNNFSWQGARDERQPQPLCPADGGDVGRQAEQLSAPQLCPLIQRDPQGWHGVYSSRQRRLGPDGAKKVRNVVCALLFCDKFIISLCMPGGILE